MFNSPSYAPSRLTINLRAIQENYLYLKKLAGDSAAVIKADGYGLGAESVAQALYNVGCRAFFTAHIGEALAVKNALSEMLGPNEKTPKINVLNGLLPDEQDIYFEHNLIPTLNSLYQVKSWITFQQEKQQNLYANLQFDSGMSRLGLPNSELQELIDSNILKNALHLQFILSHMACADTPEHPLNQKQQKYFADMIQHFPESKAMLAASSAAFLGNEYHFDLIRPGVALFGGAPNNKIANPMQQVVKLEGKILQIQQINAAQTVGYGATYQANSPSLIATIAAGYADGYLRSLSDKGHVTFKGYKLPVIGRVSMDVISIDLTSLTKKQNLLLPKVGDYVELLGADHDINVLAQEAGTIPYEILTSLGNRYERVYLHDEIV